MKPSRTACKIAGMRANGIPTIVFATLCFCLIWLFLADHSCAQKHGLVRVRLTGDRQAARVYAVDGEGRPLAPQNAIMRKTKAGRSYFYADRSFELSTPSGYCQMDFAGGLEMLGQRVALTANSETDIEVRLRPWIDMASRGWYSGDSHVHLHTGGPLTVSVADALLAARAEGLHYANLCVSNNVGDDIRDAELITGKPHDLSTRNHLLVFGEEMRSSIYGHMQFFGIKKLVEPQYTGFDNTPQHHDFPANYTMAAEAVRQGGLVTYGHPMFAGQPFPFGEDLTAGNAAARELPIDAVLGVAQAIDLMSYNSDETLSAELWYRLLNCGIALSACVGTDALLDRSTDPAGGARVYVRTDGPLTMQRWLQGLREGRSFVTNGPIPRLTVAGSRLGETHKMTEPGSVPVSALVESHVPFDRVEVIVNGRVVRNEPVKAGGDAVRRTYQVQFSLPLQHSSWVALRVRGPEHASVFDGPVWAHTSPIYVEIAGQPIRSVEDAEYFVQWIDRLLRVVAARDRYASKREREQVESLFRKARGEFQRLATPAGAAE